MKRIIFRALRLMTAPAARAAFIVCAALLLTAFAPRLYNAAPHSLQDEMTAPPPPRVFTDTERTQLAGVSNDRRKRLRLSLELAENRLARAEQLTGGQQYAPASIELGAYEALIVDAFAFMQERSNPDNKLRDLFKRFEQALRAHTRRIEAIRRITPTAYAPHVATTINLAKSLRAKALDAFFGEGSLRDDIGSDAETTNQESRALTTKQPTDNQPPIL